MTNRLYPPYFTNTVRFTTFLLSALFFLLASTSASAQGEWKWANSWSGGGGQANQFYNKTIKTAFDEDGNIYVLGQIGGHPTFNGQPLQFTDHPLAFNSNNRSTMLAKFDTLGNMLWYKMVKSSESWECYPYWMEVKDNKVYISGDMSLDYVENTATVNDVWLYYFDTLITGSQVHEIPMEQRRPPYKTGRYTYFATFDLDGNLLDHHFVTALDREISTGGVRGEFGLCSPGIGYAPFHVDSKGNIYVITELVYGGLESDPYTIIVDSDTNKIYDVYLPGNVETYGVRLSNAMMYKFSSDWELLYAKPMVNRTEGIATSWEFSLDSVNSHFRLYIYGMSVDEDDNMYVSGQLSLGLFGDYGGDLHQYPVHIYWDSTHYASILDVTSTNLMGVVVKYDTNGTVQWCNQTFTRGDNQFSAYARFAGVCVYDGALVVLGQGKYNDTENGLVFFDDESCPLQRYQQSTSNQTFFIRYDAQSGYYLNQGVFPAQNVICGLFPTVLNNRVFAYAYTIDVNSTNRDKICQWKNDGMFIETIDFTSSGDKNNPSVLANNQGNLLFDIGVTGSVVFSNSVSASCPSGQSSAVFALYHNPEFATPFVPDDSVGIDEYYQNREREIYLYPNPTDGISYVYGYMYGYKNIELFDMQGRKLGVLFEAQDFAMPYIDLSPYPAGTYLVKINFERGVSVVRKVVRM